MYMARSINLRAATLLIVDSVQWQSQMENLRRNGCFPTEDTTATREPVE